MANYECTFRTNYFGVKDEKIFQDIMSLAKIQSEDLVCYPSNTEPGKYMLGGEGAMVLYANGFGIWKTNSRITMMISFSTFCRLASAMTTRSCTKRADTKSCAMYS